MKKIIAFLLVLALAAGCCLALGEGLENKYERLRVGTTTAFNGNFFSDAIGNNVSDQDVRKLIHSYHLVSWNSDEGSYKLNPQALTSLVYVDEANSKVTLVLRRDLKYNNGTPITVRDYAFTFLLETSRQLLEAAGTRKDGGQITGWKEYDEGTASAVSGIRLTGDYQMTITLAPEYRPYFYELKALDLFPLPAEEILPGVQVKDDGQGIYLSGSFGAQALQQALLDPETGYASHPSVSSGPYKLEEFDGTQVRLTMNEYYNGNADGSKPMIPEIQVRYVEADKLISDLARGNIDLAVRCARLSQTTAGRELAAGGDFSQFAYSRNGLAYISFCGEKGPTADVKVRQAIAMCLDKETLQDEYLGAFGTPVKGYYGIGQWMFQVANGTLKPGYEEEGMEGFDWDALNLDGLTEYTLDPEAAQKLLAEAGWNLNETGGAYTEGIRYRQGEQGLEPLKLKLIYPDQNEAGPLLEELLVPYLAEAGAELELVSVPMPELLTQFYGLQERDCDMIMLGTNFGDIFDPSPEYDAEGKSRLNGITDPQLAELSYEMRRTEPGNATGYVEKWIRYLEYRTEIAPEVPLYSNAYMDFSISALREYHPNNYSSWAEALLYSYLSDFEETEEETEELEEGEEIFD